MKSFDSPGDVKRAFQFLRKKTWEDATPLDRAVFVAMLSDAPAAYSQHLLINAGVIAQGFVQWDWFADPADIGNENLPGTPFRKAYWNAGLKLPRVRHVNGWYFVPQYVICEFFNAARARKVGQVDHLETETRGTVQDDTVDTLNSAKRVIGICSATASKQRVYFIVDAEAQTLTGDAMGRLFRTTLLPLNRGGVEFGNIEFSGFTGLIATDIMRVTMEGRWFFSPRFIEEETVADD